MDHRLDALLCGGEYAPEEYSSPPPAPTPPTPPALYRRGTLSLTFALE